MDQEFENLAKRWPDLMEKSRQEYFGVGPGWYNIIDVLCGMLSGQVEQARYQLRYALENPDNKYIKPIAELEAKLGKALEELPVIAQIKEKFGSLRFYVDNANDGHSACIAFAEAMSNRTCEVCGSPGTSRNNGWVKVLCDKHNKEREEKEMMLESLHEPKRSTKSPKLSDE